MVRGFARAHVAAGSVGRSLRWRGEPELMSHRSVLNWTLFSGRLSVPFLYAFVIHQYLDTIEATWPLVKQAARAPFRHCVKAK